MNDILDKALNSFVNSYYISLSGSAGGRWPMPHLISAEVMLLIDQYFADYFLEIWREVEKRKLSIKEVAKHVPYPSPLSRIFFITRALKFQNYPKERLLKILSVVSSLMNEKYKGDPFCENGNNILLSDEDIKKIVAEQKFLYCKDNEGSCKTLQKINGLTWLYNELIFMYFHNYGHEFHGPYNIGDYQMIVREWHDLKVDYFDFSRGFPASSFASYELYSKNTKISFDISNRMSSSKPLCENLVGFSLVVNNQQLSAYEVQLFENKIEKIMAQAIESLKSSDRDSLLPKAAEMHFHVLKPIAALVGKNDEHIRQCIEKIKEKKLTEKEEQFVKNILSAKFDKPFIRAMFDPMAKGTEIFFKENKY